MYDDIEVIKNIQSIYDSNASLRILKDFERVLDELDLYVFKNWEDGALVKGPVVNRHWVECAFMWPEKKMPDPRGAKRLLDYDCKITFEESKFKSPRRIKKPSDYRLSSKKGQIDEHPIWIVTIKMPKQLMFEIFKGSVKGAVDKDVDIESLYQDLDTGTSKIENAPAEQATQDVSNEQPTA